MEINWIYVIFILCALGVMASCWRMSKAVEMDWSFLKTNKKKGKK